jgi:hypothetical protein
VRQLLSRCREDNARPSFDARSWSAGAVAAKHDGCSKPK